MGTHYVKAQRIRKLIVDAFLGLFRSIDLIAMPTTAFTAPRIGQTKVTIRGKDYDFLDHVMLFTGTMSVTGLPCISIPNGMSVDRLPTALELIGGPFDEASLVNVACVHEKETKFSSTKMPA